MDSRVWRWKSSQPCRQVRSSTSLGEGARSISGAVQVMRRSCPDARDDGTGLRRRRAGERGLVGARRGDRGRHRELQPHVGARGVGAVADLEGALVSVGDGLDDRETEPAAARRARPARVAPGEPLGDAGEQVGGEAGAVVDDVDDRGAAVGAAGRR